jgi:hypothetical protein
MSRKYSSIMQKRESIDIEFFPRAGGLGGSALVSAESRNQDAKLRRYGCQGLGLIKDGIYSLIVDANRSKA